MSTRHTFWWCSCLDTRVGTGAAPFDYLFVPRGDSSLPAGPALPGRCESGVGGGAGLAFRGAGIEFGDRIGRPGLGQRRRRAARELMTRMLSPRG